MSDDKVYTPLEIKDNPLPNDQQDSFSDAEGTKTPATITDNPLPLPKIANDVVSSTLDTLAQKIKGAYKFTRTGALQIGQFILGVSGEIKLSPDGIVAKNQAGDTTFAIDGRTGDAIFKGTVQAAGFVIADEKGLNSLGNFVSARLISNTPQSTGSTSFVDVSGSSFSIHAGRDVKVLFIIFAYLGTGHTEFAVSQATASLRLFDDFLNGEAVGELISPGNHETAVTVDGTGHVLTYDSSSASQGVELSAILTVAKGDHNYKLQMKTSAGTAGLDAFIINIITLGS